MSNICKVTDHIYAELKKQHSEEIEQRVLQPISTSSGGAYATVDGKNWRVYRFMKGLKSYDFAQTPEQVYEGGKAFGQFLSLLANYPAETLVTTINDFHNVFSRLDKLKIVLKTLNDSKPSDVTDLVKFIFDISDEMSEIEHLVIQKKIPIRVTHNDTKFNNVLLDQNDKAICVIDLDTVMPGIVHYDFGDGIRTGASTATEDETDLSLVDIDLNKFEAFSAGYLEMTSKLLLPIEIQHLAKSSALLSYLMAVRFLTDHLSGNKYYKVDFARHNLDRAKNQCRLTALILKRLDVLNQVITKHSVV